MKKIASQSKKTESKRKLLSEVSFLIEKSKSHVSTVVNQQLTLLYWNIGKVIKQDILQNKRADYGEKTITTLSEKLTQKYGSGWSRQQLWNCLYTVEIFPSFKIISTLSRELSWSHLKELI